MNLVCAIEPEPEFTREDEDEDGGKEDIDIESSEFRGEFDETG